MSEANSGSGILSGNPASDPAAGIPAAGAPSAAPDVNTPPVDDAGKPPAAANGNWYDNFEDVELKGYAEVKGWKDPADLANSYKNLEKLIGSEKIPMPKGEDDAEGWNRLYDSLGRPKTAEEYKLPVPEGDNGEFANVAAGKFHELGLNAKQAAGLAEWWNATQAGQMEQMNATKSSNTEAEITGLKTEWGKAYDENVEFGRRAAREYGLDGDKLTKIEGAIGTGEMLKLMARIGRSTGEAGYVDGESGSKGFGMTPAAAQSRVAALRQDKDWTAKYLGGNADAKAELDKLMKLAYPE